MPELLHTAATSSSRSRIRFAGAAALFFAAALGIGALFLLHTRAVRLRERSRLALLRETSKIAERERAERERLRIRFRNDLRERCRPHLEAARRGAADTAKELGSFSACVTLGTAAIRDRVRDTRDFETAYLALLDKPVIQPCLLAKRDAEAALADHALRLRENRLAFTVALAAAHGDLPDLTPPTELPPRLQELLAAVAGRTISLHAARAAAAVGAALELAFLRSGCRSAAKLFAAAAATFCGSASLGGICAAADGPLPIGDIVGGVLTVGGSLWTAYDLYEVSCVLPRQLAEELETGIGEFGARLLADTEARAAELEEAFRRDAETISDEVRRRLDAGRAVPTGEK